MISIPADRPQIPGQAGPDIRTSAGKNLAKSSIPAILTRMGPAGYHPPGCHEFHCSAEMKKRLLILICLVVVGLVGWVFVRAVPIGAFSIPYFVASIDEGHQVTGMPWRIVYNDAGAAHSGNFWTWVIEDRGICRVVVAQGYSTVDVRYGDSPIPVKIEDSSIYLGFANSRHGDELEWQKINTRKSIAEVSKAVEKPVISIPQSSDPPMSWIDEPPREDNRAEQDGTGQPATRPESKSVGGDILIPESEGRSR